MTERDSKLDILRTIGILLIFLAHVECPFFVRQTRIFDVILLVMISGYVYTEPKDFFKYILKRIKRLVFPTWIFLTLFFFMIYIVEFIFNIKINIFSTKEIISSYLFGAGIGFVWIIRVYLGTSIFGPLLVKKIQRNTKNLIYIYILTEIFILYIVKKINNTEILYFVGILQYILIFCYGKLLKEKKFQIKKVLLLLSCLMIVFFISKGIVDIGFYKYPPRIIYIWYGIFVSTFLFWLKDKVKVENNLLKKFCEYIGKSTMWFYLLHILIYYFFKFLKKYISINWIEEYCFLVILTFILLLLKDFFLKKLYKIFPENRILKVFEG